MTGFVYVVFPSDRTEATPSRNDRPVIGLGPLLAVGRTSEVFALGAASVVKVPRAEVPPHWAGVEARIADAVHAVGLPTPEVRDLIKIDGRDSIVFERIEGPSMWQLLLEDPTKLAGLTRQMIEVQQAINGVDAPEGVPDLRNRICSKIAEACLLTSTERENALGLTNALPSGVSLCHGDLHPGNILMGESGPVVIDWFDAGTGHCAADSVRTSLLIRPPVTGLKPPHLPGASPALLQEMHRIFLDDVVARSGGTVPELLQWERVLAASRLAEDTNTDHDDLLALWRSTGGPNAKKTQLAVELAGLGFV